MKLFKRKRSKREPRVIKLWEHNSWGNSVMFSDWEDRRIVGFLRNRPHKGDYIKTKMESGKIGVFKIKNVEYETDPRDMFYATVSDVGYEEDVKI